MSEFEAGISSDTTTTETTTIATEFPIHLSPALTITPIVTSLFSLVGSSCIIYLILFKRRKSLKGNSATSTYHRLVLGLSIYDVMNSAWTSTSIYLEPAGIKEGSIGNRQTCSAQGFFYQIGLTSAIYSACLAVHFLMRVKNFSKDFVTRRVEPYFHGFSILVPLSFGIVGLALQLYNPSDRSIGCYIAYAPMGCDLSSNPEIPCTRGLNADLFVWMFAASIVVSCFTIVLISMIWLVVLVYKSTSNVRRRYRVVNSQNQSTSASRRTHQTFIQATFYIGAFFSTYFWTSLLKVLPDDADPTAIFTISLMSQMLYPLQGFMNFFIFIRPHYINLKRQHPNASSVAILLEILAIRSTLSNSSGSNRGHGSSIIIRSLANLSQNVSSVLFHRRSCSEEDLPLSTELDARNPPHWSMSRSFRQINKVTQSLSGSFNFKKMSLLSSQESNLNLSRDSFKSCALHSLEGDELHDPSNNIIFEQDEYDDNSGTRSFEISGESSDHQLCHNNSSARNSHNSIRSINNDHDNLRQQTSIITRTEIMAYLEDQNLSTSIIFNESRQTIASSDPKDFSSRSNVRKFRDNEMKLSISTNHSWQQDDSVEDETFQAMTTTECDEETGLSERPLKEFIENDDHDDGKKESNSCTVDSYQQLTAAIDEKGPPTTKMVEETSDPEPSLEKSIDDEDQTNLSISNHSTCQQRTTAEEEKCPSTTKVVEETNKPEPLPKQSIDEDETNLSISNHSCQQRTTAEEEKLSSTVAVEGASKPEPSLEEDDKTKLTISSTKSNHSYQQLTDAKDEESPPTTTKVEDETIRPEALLEKAIDADETKLSVSNHSCQHLTTAQEEKFPPTTSAEEEPSSIENFEDKETISTNHSYDQLTTAEDEEFPSTTIVEETIQPESLVEKIVDSEMKRTLSNCSFQQQNSAEDEVTSVKQTRNNTTSLSFDDKPD